eukprot:4692815-Pyramimonas_sp.AAC.1
MRVSRRKGEQSVSRGMGSASLRACPTGAKAAGRLPNTPRWRPTCLSRPVATPSELCDRWLHARASHLHAFLKSERSSLPPSVLHSKTCCA